MTLPFLASVIEIGICWSANWLAAMPTPREPASPAVSVSRSDADMLARPEAVSATGRGGSAGGHSYGADSG